MTWIHIREQRRGPPWRRPDAYVNSRSGLDGSDFFTESVPWIWIRLFMNCKYHIQESAKNHVNTQGVTINRCNLLFILISTCVVVASSISRLMWPCLVSARILL